LPFFSSETLNPRSLQPLSVYLGVDPSAPSLHAGNLLALLALLHFTTHSHQAFLLVGGATGSIGDPSGRSSERNALDHETLERNVRSIEAQVGRFFERGREYASKRGLAGLSEESDGEGKQEGGLESWKEPRVVNNLDWTKEVSLLDFLRGVGKAAKVSTMIARDSYVIHASPYLPTLVSPMC
jgi:tyrosyl-tRNA synthetase